MARTRGKDKLGLRVAGITQLGVAGAHINDTRGKLAGPARVNRAIVQKQSIIDTSFSNGRKKNIFEERRGGESFETSA